MPPPAGFLTAYPCGGTIPFVSNVNYLAGPQATANAATVAANGSNQVCIFASVPVHVVVDIAGRFGGGGSSFVPATPTRILDTRPGVGGWQGSASLLQAVTVDLSAAIPPSATGLIGTATAITDREAFVTVYPARPRCSGGLEPQPRGLDADGQRRHHPRPEPRHPVATATATSSST